MSYPISTILLIIFFFLLGLSYLAFWTAPAILMGILAIGIAISLAVRR